MAVYVSVKGGDKLNQALQKLAKNKISIRAGFPSGATGTNGASIPAYAAYNEFGTKRIPSRPFMRTTANNCQQKWVDALAKVLNIQALQGDPKSACAVVGDMMRADIVETIQRGSFAPNSPKTIAAKARKGKSEPDHPLIDTGQMIAAVISEVKDE